MEPPSTASIHILNPSGLSFNGAYLKDVALHTLGSGGRSVSEPLDLEIVLLDDDAMRELNFRTRGIGATTDVLTFPAPDFPGAPLGEICISLETAQTQAAARGITLEQELGYLVIHGCLHLLGYDDIESADRVEMFKHMHRIGLELDLPEQPEWLSLHYVEGAK